MTVFLNLTVADSITVNDDTCRNAQLPNHYINSRPQIMKTEGCGFSYQNNVIASADSLYNGT